MPIQQHEHEVSNKASPYTAQVSIWIIGQNEIKQAAPLSAAEHNPHHPDQPA